MTTSRARVFSAAFRRMSDGLVIAGALAATAIAVVALLGLFVMVGKLSQRREDAGASSTLSSLPAQPPQDAAGGNLT
jgi:hypothetical protein